MSHLLRDFHQLTDADLEREHDKLAVHTVVGIDYYLDEIRRREMAAAMRSSQRVAFAATTLSVVSTVIAVVSLFVR